MFVSEEEIDFDAFLDLTSDDLKEYLPKHGQRIKFMKKLSELKSTLAVSTTPLVMVTTVPCLPNKSLVSYGGLLLKTRVFLENKELFSLFKANPPKCI